MSDEKKPSITEIAQEALELAEKATPGPWTVDSAELTASRREFFVAISGVAFLDDTPRIDAPTDNFEWTIHKRAIDDAALMAFSRTALPALAHAVADQAAEIARLRGALEAERKIIHELIEGPLTENAMNAPTAARAHRMYVMADDLRTIAERVKRNVDEYRESRPASIQWSDVDDLSAFALAVLDARAIRDVEVYRDSDPNDTFVKDPAVIDYEYAMRVYAAIEAASTRPEPNQVTKPETKGNSQ